MDFLPSFKSFFKFKTHKAHTHVNPFSITYKKAQKAVISVASCIAAIGKSDDIARDYKYNAYDVGIIVPVFGLRCIMYCPIREPVYWSISMLNF